MYVASLISIRLVLYFPRYVQDEQPLWKMGDNWIHIHGMIIAIVFRPSSHCHLSINQVSFQSMLYFPKYGPDRQHLWKMYRVWLWFVGSALPLIAIYLNTKFYLNGNSSFKVICRTRYQDGRKDGRTKRWIYASPFG